MADTIINELNNTFEYLKEVATYADKTIVEFDGYSFSSIMMYNARNNRFRKLADKVCEHFQITESFIYARKSDIRPEVLYYDFFVSHLLWCLTNTQQYKVKERLESSYNWLFECKAVDAVNPKVSTVLKRKQYTILVKQELLDIEVVVNFDNEQTFAPTIIFYDSSLECPTIFYVCYELTDCTKLCDLLKWFHFNNKQERVEPKKLLGEFL